MCAENICFKVTMHFYEAFDTLHYGSGWHIILLAMMPLSFIWNLHFSLSGSSGTCGDYAETTALCWEEADKPRARIPGTGNSSDHRAHASAPEGPERITVCSESLICPFYILHIPEDLASRARALGQEGVPVLKGILNNNRPLWPWVQES